MVFPYSQAPPTEWWHPLHFSLQPKLPPFVPEPWTKGIPHRTLQASSNPSLLHHGMGERRDDVSRMIYQSLEKKNKLKGIFFWTTQCSITNSPWWYSVDCCDVAACYFDFDINLMTVITLKPSPLAWSMAPHLQDQGCQQKVSCNWSNASSNKYPQETNCTRFDFVGPVFVLSNLSWARFSYPESMCYGFFDQGTRE